MMKIVNVFVLMAKIEHLLFPGFWIKMTVHAATLCSSIWSEKEKNYVGYA